MKTTSTNSTPVVQRFGLVAGWGRFPILVAEALKRQGIQVYCLGIAGHAHADALTAVCDDYQTVGISRLGKQIRYFRRNNVTHATMAGKIFKTMIFERFVWLKHLPDWAGVKMAFPFFITRKKNRNDDALLTAVVDAYATGGVTFAPATDFAPELLVNEGHLAGPKISWPQEKDIAFGWHLAKEMGRLDVGQSVMVKDQAVLAIEAVEGTDECIRRAGTLCRSGGFTVVKVAKPHQDMRFDVPTIGVGTLETMVASGGRVLAVEADKTIIVDREEVATYAKRHGISIHAIRDAAMQKAAA